jgi:hypothetical protein
MPLLSLSQVSGAWWHRGVGCGVCSGLAKPIGPWRDPDSLLENTSQKLQQTVAAQAGKGWYAGGHDSTALDSGGSITDTCPQCQWKHNTARV